MHTRKLVVAYIIAAFLSALTAISTIILPQWFELLFDEAPDDGDGSLEALITIVVSALACLVFSMLARRVWLGKRVSVA